jgi:hypothetical protein
MKIILVLLLLVIRSVHASVNNILLAHDPPNSIESSLSTGYITTSMHNDAVKKVIDEIKSRQNDQHIGTHLL